MRSKKFAKLKTLMFTGDITQEGLAAEIGRSKGYLNRRLNGLEPFDTTDIREICGVLEIPLAECVDYFFEP